jgi:hypothetical protein
LGLFLSLVFGLLGLPFSLEKNLVPLLLGELIDVHLHLILLLLILVGTQGSTFQVNLNTSLLDILLLKWVVDLSAISVLASCLEMCI